MIRLGLGMARRRRAFTGAVYRPEAQAYFAAMAPAPGSARKTVLDALIAGLVADGLWVKLDWLSLFAAHHAQAARINVVDPARSFGIVGTPGFAADRGFTGASGSYLASGWNPATEGINFQQNSGFIALWCVSSVQSANIPVGNQLNLVAPLAGTTIAGRLNQAANTSVAGASAAGLTAVDRSGAAAVKLLKDGLQVATGATASAAPTADDFYALTFNNAGTPNTSNATQQLAAVAWGAHLSDGEHLALYDRLNTYLMAVGAA